MPKVIKILSIDGGGIRGIIPAMILKVIETATERPISDLFDLIAGTSTGGILALGLTKPNAQGKPAYSAEKMIGLYEEKGPIIFNRSIWKKIHFLGNLTNEKYPAGPIEKILEDYFGEVLLSDSLKPVVIPSYEIESRTPYFFKTSKAKENPQDNFRMRQVARATSAAPTYFAPCRLDIPGQDGYYALIDGGVFANNPTMCAFAEAKKFSSPEDDFLVVSLGTGELTRAISYEEAEDWGLLGWAPHILNVVFDGMLDTVDYQMQWLLPEVEGQLPRYYRFQTKLDVGYDDMDDASQTNLLALQTKAREIISTRSAELGALCHQLKQ